MKKWGMYAVVLLLVAYPAIAANAPNIVNQDYIIVLDQSGSMREKVPGNPKSGYEKNPRKAHKSRGAVDALDIIVTDMLQDGDYFSLVNFGNSANVVFSQQISFPHERELFRRAISAMRFGDKHTDILAGIKKASDLMIAMNTPQRRKVFILITDGKNEPPDDSPYLSEEAQEAFYQDLRDAIKTNKWDMTLVGIGEYTEENIREIADKLDLPFEKAIVVKNPQSSEEIQQKLTRIFEEKRDERVVLQARTISLVFKPDWLGKYKNQSDSLQLDSSFADEVSIQFDPQNPVVMEQSDALSVTVSPQQISIASQQSAPVTLNVALTGTRPENGQISGTLVFQLSRESIDFSPKECEIEVLVKSWAEVYGLYAGLAVAAIVVALMLSVMAIRKAQVPEIRIEVVSGSKTLGEPIRLKKKQSFTIDNSGDFSSGKSISAKPLTCRNAATVTYLGRRKFLVKADEAKIVDDGREVRSLQIKMEGSFDLKDSSGKMLRGITITSPGKGSGDMFGSGGGDDFLT